MINRILFLTFLIKLAFLPPVCAQLSSLPLIGINSLVYEGAFRIPDNTYGASSANYSAGAIAYYATNESIFLAGHYSAIAEFSIPELVNSTMVEDLNTSENLQPFRYVLNDAPGGNPQIINTISGMCIIDGQLVINAVEYYDAPANNTHTTLVLDTPADLNNTGINGYFSLVGAAHAAGWLSPIPVDIQTELGGDYLVGNSSRYPINSRSPMGISAFALSSSNFAGSTPGTIPTATLLDFNLAHRLSDDYSSYASGSYNLIEINGSTHTGHTFEDADAVVGNNHLWTEVSSADYGFLVPGTRTYLTVGASGGHNGGIGYKPTQNNGNTCGGPCPYDAEDRYNYYWLWDALDLLAVKNGTMEAYEVRPYAYGMFDVPFQRRQPSNTPAFRPVSGGSYNAEDNLLYLTVHGAGQTGNYSANPVIVAYSINATILPVTLVNFNAKPIRNSSILLTWQTEMEHNNDGFRVQRRIEGEQSFSTIGWVTGHGNSEEAVSYEFEDKEAPLNVSCYYRLQQLDFAGSSNFSVMRSARLESPTASVQIYPNPSSAWVNIVSKDAPISRVVVYNQLGRVVSETITNQLNVSKLSPGLYKVCTLLSNNKLSVEKLLVY